MLVVDQINQVVDHAKIASYYLTNKKYLLFAIIKLENIWMINIIILYLCKETIFEN